MKTRELKAWLTFHIRRVAEFFPESCAPVFEWLAWKFSGRKALLPLPEYSDSREVLALENKRALIMRLVRLKIDSYLPEVELTLIEQGLLGITPDDLEKAIKNHPEDFPDKSRFIATASDDPLRVMVIWKDGNNLFVHWYPRSTIFLTGYFVVGVA